MKQKKYKSKQKSNSNKKCSKSLAFQELSWSQILKREAKVFFMVFGFMIMISIIIFIAKPLMFYKTMNIIASMQMNFIAINSVDNMDIRNLTHEITKHSNSDYSKLRVIYSYVVENIEFENDPGNMDLFQTPEQTIEYGFGDCDDIAVLTCSMARSIGFECSVYVEPQHAFCVCYSNSNVLDSENHSKMHRYTYAIDPAQHRFEYVEMV